MCLTLAACDTAPSDDVDAGSDCGEDCVAPADCTLESRGSSCDEVLIGKWSGVTTEFSGKEPYGSAEVTLEFLPDGILRLEGSDPDMGQDHGCDAATFIGEGFYATGWDWPSSGHSTHDDAVWMVLVTSVANRIFIDECNDPSLNGTEIQGGSLSTNDECTPSWWSDEETLPRALVCPQRHEGSNTTSLISTWTEVTD